MTQVLEEFPGAQRALFRNYHIGGCSSCGFQPTETLQQVCDRNNKLDLEAVIRTIRQGHEADLQMQLTPAQLRDLRAGNPALKIVDIRTREEWDVARIEGAVHFTQELMQEILSRWPREEMIVFCDHLGKKALDAAAYFQGHGFTHVKFLAGGIYGWSREVEPAVRRYKLE
ncbi:MAG: rhodanese-like domain-containing protein [Verrucomicrobiota bacterium]|nr:rhodanese-like domain-containing protein [Verrucomicrobiota bacterium]